MTEPVWIDKAVALALHQRLLAVDGGGSGVREPGLLEGALARPQQQFAYSAAPNLIDMAAAYSVGIVKSHPFIDGNKRTGFVVGVLFLELNGLRFSASEAEATQAVMGLAAGEIDEAGYTAFLRANATPADARSG